LFKCSSAFLIDYLLGLLEPLARLIDVLLGPPELLASAVSRFGLEVPWKVDLFGFDLV